MALARLPSAVYGVSLPTQASVSPPVLLEPTTWPTVPSKPTASVPALALTLATHGSAVALHVVDSSSTIAIDVVQRTPADRVIDELAAADAPLGRRALRDACRMRSAAIGPLLVDLLASGRVVQHECGYALASATRDTRFPLTVSSPSLDPVGNGNRKPSIKNLGDPAINKPAQAHQQLLKLGRLAVRTPSEKPPVQDGDRKSVDSPSPT